MENLIQNSWLKNLQNARHAYYHCVNLSDMVNIISDMLYYESDQ
jgi:hypothetical protein